MEGNSATHIPRPKLLDLTGQIIHTISDHVATGPLGDVYRCDWRNSTGHIEVAVKVIKIRTEDYLRRLRKEARILARYRHENIVPLFGTTKDFGSFALVSLWFQHGTLLRLITDQGVRLSTKSKLNLLHDIASGLRHLHNFHIVHTDITSSNVLVDIMEGGYKACLTDVGLSTVPGGLLNDYTIEGSTVLHGAIRWAAPELLQLAHGHPVDTKPTKQTDMYSFGRVMFHVLTLCIPWDGIDDSQLLLNIRKGEEIKRPEIHVTPDITDSRWNMIELCWSTDPFTRLSASKAVALLKSELEAPKVDGVLVGDAQESLNMVDTKQTSASNPLRCPSPTETEGTESHYELLPHEPYKWPLSPSSGDLELQQLKVETATPPSNTVTPSSPATASSLSVSGPFNILIFGETGVGKSSVINLIMRRDVARTSPDALTCTLEHTPYDITLGDCQFKLWEVSSIASLGFFSRLFAKWRLKKAFNKLYKDHEVFLLLYCMRNSRAQGPMVKDYKLFTSIVGPTAARVPIAAVVTCLEDYPGNMDDWWKNNEKNLIRNGMRFSKHACITSLPDDPHASKPLRDRRCWSETAIRTLIHDSYRAGTSDSTVDSVPTLIT